MQTKQQARRNRKTLQGYVFLTTVTIGNKLVMWKKWKASKLREAGDKDRVLTCMTEDWLSNATLWIG